MFRLIQIGGGLWAFIGAANVVLMDWGQMGDHSRLLAMGLILNFALFIFPGLVLVGIFKSRRPA
jgi:hypothetical protein